MARDRGWWRTHTHIVTLDDVNQTESTNCGLLVNDKQESDGAAVVSEVCSGHRRPTELSNAVMYRHTPYRPHDLLTKFRLKSKCCVVKPVSFTGDLPFSVPGQSLSINTATVSFIFMCLTQTVHRVFTKMTMK